MIDFEKINQGFKELGGLALDLCRGCGGYCEHNDLAAYLPGEEEFIAEKPKMSPGEFCRKYASKIRYKNHTINLLRISDPCPFLKKYRCQLEKYDAKPLVCLLYPVYITREQNRNKILLDVQSCPMAGKFPKGYVKKAMDVYRKIESQIPKYWLEFTTKYGGLLYDYKKLSELENKKFITVKELVGCIRK